jgi:hypothetical protein
MIPIDLRGASRKCRKRSAYDEDSEISSDDEHIKKQIRNSTFYPSLSGSTNKIDELRRTDVGEKKTHRWNFSTPHDPSVRVAALEEPERDPDLYSLFIASAAPSLSTPPPTP